MEEDFLSDKNGIFDELFGGSRGNSETLLATLQPQTVLNRIFTDESVINHYMNFSEIVTEVAREVYSSSFKLTEGKQENHRYFSLNAGPVEIVYAATFSEPKDPYSDFVYFTYIGGLSIHQEKIKFNSTKAFLEKLIEYSKLVGDLRKENEPLIIHKRGDDILSQGNDLIEKLQLPKQKVCSLDLFPPNVLGWRYG